METKSEILGNQGNVMDLRLDQIRPSEINCYKTDRIDELEDSIRLYGLLTPLTVARNDNHYEILSGHRRYKALLQMYAHQGLDDGETGGKKVPCLVVGGDDLDPIIKELVIELANLEQREITDVFDHRMNVVRLYHELCEKNIIDSDDVKRRICEGLKISDRYARMYDSIFQGGTEELKKAVASTSKTADKDSHAHIPLHRASVIANLPEEEQREIIGRSDAGESISDIMKSRKPAKLSDFSKPDGSLTAAETEYGEDESLVAPAAPSWDGETDDEDYGNASLDDCMKFLDDNAPHLNNSIDTVGNRIGSLEAERSARPSRDETRTRVAQWLSRIGSMTDPARLTPDDRELIEEILDMADHLERLIAG